MSRPQPERTCVGCRRRAPKRELLRLVGSQRGVTLEREAVLPGRGAYVHRDEACVRDAVHRGSLGRALRVAIGPDEASNLLRELLTLTGS